MVRSAHIGYEHALSDLIYYSHKLLRSFDVQIAGAEFRAIASRARDIRRRWTHSKFLVCSYLHVAA